MQSWNVINNDNVVQKICAADLVSRCSAGCWN